MDGSGKDTLIQDLMAYGLGDVPLRLHPRASTSLGGPLPDLAQWVENDLDYLENEVFDFRHIYNRHPLISEPIYADYRSNRKPLAAGFENGDWWTAQANRMAAQSIVVWVHPPFQITDAVLRSQGLKAHMPGVYENRLKIYSRYATFNWPGNAIRYDRTRDSVPALVNTIKLKLEH
jgi:hypothetical protein